MSIVRWSFPQLSKFHLHLTIDAIVENPPRDEETAEKWLNDLVESVEMVKLGGPWVTYCDDPDNRGLTGVVWLTTSHSSFHFWDNCEQPFVKFDIYSCRDYDLDLVTSYFDEAFGIVKGSWTYMDRSHPYELPIIKQGRISGGVMERPKKQSWWKRF